MPPSPKIQSVLAISCHLDSFTEDGKLTMSINFNTLPLSNDPKVNDFLTNRRRKLVSSTAGVASGLLEQIYEQD